MKSRRLGWSGHVVRIVATRISRKILFENSEGKEPFGRVVRRWDDNIKMDLKKEESVRV
jgi:hypothetical protein